jgi:hypothetical protein
MGGELVYLTNNGYGTMEVFSLESYSKSKYDVENLLDEADRLAENNCARMSHEEVFGNLRRKTKTEQ